jgi:hypothetical protein
MIRYFSECSLNLRALSPARVFAFIGALGTFFIGMGYLIADPLTVKDTILYQTLDVYAGVKPFGALMLITGGAIMIGALLNKRSIVGVWAFVNVLIWIFIGVLFTTAVPEAWFTIIALWPINFMAAIYTRYLSVRPPADGDDRFDYHVDSTRERVLESIQQVK